MRGLRQGMYADWNECLRHVKTEYFYFLTSDDTCMPQLISETTRALDQYPHIDACHFLYEFIDKHGQTTHTPSQVIQSNFKIYQEPNKYAHIRSGLCEFMLHLIYRSVYRTMTSLVMRRSLISHLHSFSSQYGSAGDFDWTMRLCTQTDVLFIPQRLATWRLYEAQATQVFSSEKIAENIKIIALKNLDYFLSTNNGRILVSQMGISLLKSRLRDEHASSIFRSINLKNFVMAFSKLIKILRLYPFYVPRKIINRWFSTHHFFYLDQDVLAMEIIGQLQLNWPPQHIEISTTSHTIQP
jgi:Glycosyl transferase family 2